MTTKPQSIITLTCLYCRRAPMGLSGGPAASARLQLYGRESTTICPHCATDAQREAFAKKIVNYYHAKAEGRGERLINTSNN